MIELDSVCSTKAMLIKFLNVQHHFQLYPPLIFSKLGHWFTLVYWLLHPQSHLVYTATTCAKIAMNTLTTC